MNKKIKAFEEIIKVMDKHNEIVAHESSIDIRRTLTDKIKLQKIADSFSIELGPRYEGAGSWLKLSEHCAIGLYGENHRRTISWSDDGRQPEEEWLYQISFPTGAYIFGDYFSDFYPTETFNAFFVELKSYGPKYSDSNNHNLYFSADTAKKVHEKFDEIFKKYRELAREEYKKIQVRKLQEELAELTGGETVSV